MKKKYGSLIYNILSLIGVIVYGVCTYKSIKLDSFKLDSNLDHLIFTKLNITIISAAVLYVVLLFLKAPLINETQSFTFTKWISWTSAKGEKEVVVNKTDNLMANMTYLNSIRIKSKKSLIASIQKDEHINVIFDKIVEDILLFWKKESGLSVKANIVEYSTIEDEAIIELFKSSLESNKAEIIEVAGLNKKRKILLYAYKFKDQEYAFITKSFNYKFEQSDAEFITTYMGMVFDWYATKQILCAAQENLKGN